jgi:hypothetical protein
LVKFDCADDLPGSVAIRWSVVILEPAAMNRFALRHFELAGPSIPALPLDV